ncbi:MAG: 4-hydroxy-3-methylbut-2-enyl diphosphate reductase, partial [Atribacterota bacterium]
YKWFHPKDKVGITSGASTPDWITNEIIDKLKEWYG